MQIGDICIVADANSHRPSQIGDLILITEQIGSGYVAGINLKTNKTHHYLKLELEKIKCAIKSN